MKFLKMIYFGRWNISNMVTDLLKHNEYFFWKCLQTPKMWKFQLNFWNCITWNQVDLYTTCIFITPHFDWKTVRRVWRYQRGNQNPYIAEQTTQWPKEKVQSKGQTTIYKTYTYNKRSHNTNPTKVDDRSHVTFWVL